MQLPFRLRLLMLLMVLSSQAIVTTEAMTLLWAHHKALHPASSFASIPGTTAVLMFFPAIFGQIAPALMLANFCLHRVSAFRRILDENAKSAPGASYRSAMRGLQKFATVTVPLAMVIALIGAVEP
jgi:hypothetical protein